MIENKEILIILIPVIMDVVAGAIPDKWLKYKGLFRKILKELLKVLEK